MEPIGGVVSGQGHQPAQTSVAPADAAQQSSGAAAGHGNAAAALQLKEEGGGGAQDLAETLDELRRRIADPARSADSIRADAGNLFGASPEAEVALAFGSPLLATLVQRVGPRAAPAMLEGSGLTLGECVRQLDASGTFDLAAWGTLVEGLPGAMVLPVLEDELAFALLKKLPGDPVALLGSLGRDPGNLSYVLDALPQVGSWITERAGAARLAELQALVEDTADATQERAAHVQAGDLLKWLEELPDGPATDAAVQRKLYVQLMAAEDDREISVLFRKRFGQTLTAIGSASWSKTDVVQMWRVAEQLPGADFTDIATIQRGDSGPSLGGGGFMHLTMADPEHGLSDSSESDNQNPLLGLNVFNSTLRHEVGHNVAKKAGWDSEGGWMFQLGWRLDKSLSDILGSVLVPAMPLQASLSTAEEQALQAAFDTCEETEFSPANLQAAMSAELWAKVSGESLIHFMVARASDEGGRYKGAALPVAGRMYHAAKKGRPEWYSVPQALYDKRVSDYMMYSPAEYFAEAYATFYADADQPGGQVGGLLKARDPALEKQFQDKVHGRHDLGKETGQTQS